MTDPPRLWCGSAGLAGIVAPGGLACNDSSADVGHNISTITVLKSLYVLILYFITPHQTKIKLDEVHDKSPQKNMDLMCMNSTFYLGVAAVIIPRPQQLCFSPIPSLNNIHQKSPPLKEKKRVCELNCQRIYYYVFLSVFGHLNLSTHNYQIAPNSFPILPFLPILPPFKSMKKKIYIKMSV